MNSVWKPYGKPYTSKEELEAALRSFDYKKLVQELGEPLEFRVTQIEK